MGDFLEHAAHHPESLDGLRCSAIALATVIGGVTATNALRRSWRDAHAHAAVGTATATAVPAVVVAEPVGVASPTFVPQATATAVPVMGYPQ